MATADLAEGSRHLQKACDSEELLSRLGQRGRTGSKARCHFLTHGDRAKVARRLTYLCLGAGPDVQVLSSDRWMPVGFDEVKEAELDRAGLLPSVDQQSLTDWWLVEKGPNSRTPNWDIASTCTIDGRQGFVLVEAKAHGTEFSDAGKRLRGGDSGANHKRIGEAIIDANEGLGEATGLDWGLSRNRSYQLSNRFAWAWKVCTLGYPVAIVYLGFVGAIEMEPDYFRDEEEWITLVLSKTIVPAKAWSRRGGGWNWVGVVSGLFNQ